MTEHPCTILRGTVEKIIPSPTPGEPERVQIAVEGAELLYKELRIENKLFDAGGNHVRLKPGAKVQVTVEAEPHHVTIKYDL